MNDAPAFVLVWTLQATLLLSLGLAAAACWRRRAAGAHACLLLSLVLVPVLPVLSWGLRPTGAGLLPTAVFGADIGGSSALSGERAAGTGQAAAASQVVDAAGGAGRTGGRGNAGGAGGAGLAISQNDAARANNNPRESATALHGGVRPLAENAAAAGADSSFGIITAVWIGWCVLSAAALMRLGWGLIAGVRLRRASVPCTDRALNATLVAAARDVGLNRRIELRRSDLAACPMICCWGVPCVLVPARIPAGVDWRAVMVHELAHLARRDHVSALAAELVCCLLAWHPLAWLARRRMTAAAEQACDDWALRHASSEADYAEALVAFVGPRSAVPMAPAIVSASGVGARITRILSGRRGPARLGRLAAAAVLAATATAAGVASLAQPAAERSGGTGEILNAEGAENTEKQERSVGGGGAGETGVGDADAIGSFLAYWRKNAGASDRGKLWEHARNLAKTNDPRIIPAMIGVIDADNSYDTVYGVGYFGLSGITGVDYSPFRDGAWWRRWWEDNKARFPDAAAEPIPDLPRSAAGKKHTPYPEDLDTFDGKIRWLLKDYERLREGKLTTLGLSGIAGEIAKHKDARAIPTMIGVIDADNSYDTVYGVGYFGLSPLTDVAYSPYHDGAWWRRWWEANKTKFPPEAQAVPIPGLPKTRHGAGYTPFPADLETYDGLVRKLLEDYTKPQPTELGFSDIARGLVKLKDMRAIPVLIGVIDADNSYNSIYGLGYFGLGELTGVSYSPYHDGAWWRRWWEANKTKYPAEARAVPIPDLPKTVHGRGYTPMPESFGTFDGKIAWLLEAFWTGRDVTLNDFAEALASHQDPRAIPFLIGLIDADNTERTIYWVGHFGLGDLVKSVKYDASHDGAWWRGWWERNKSNYPEAARETPIPDLKEPFAAWVAGEVAREQARFDAQFEGFPRLDLRAGGDERKRYFLFGPASSQPMPEAGWGLLLILPGGAGGADFQPFCRSIHRDALPEGFVAAELVAPVWSDDPGRAVWPTRMSNNDKAPFTTEDFIRAVVDDVGGRLTIDRSRILALGWSSGGPALYCDSLQPDTPVTGWLIAMSVFRPQWMPDVAAAKGRRYYILHSPQDSLIPIEEHAKSAEARLRGAGAAVMLAEYSGGHGWTEDPMGHIRRGVEWLLTKEP